MDALDSINWSEVARAAFDNAIQQQKSMKVQNMEDVIERLRQSKAVAEGADEAAGKRDGSVWAQKDASYRDLKRIGTINLDARVGQFASQVDVVLGNDGQSWGESFWNNGEFETAPNDAYVFGWVEGAMSVWDQVGGKI
jgi:hypothetical protein